MNSTDSDLRTSGETNNPSALLRIAHSEAWRERTKADDVYTGGILRLDIHLDGDLRDNMERINKLIKDSVAEVSVSTPYGDGVCIDGMLFSGRRALLWDEVRRAGELGVIGLVSMLDKQNDPIHRAREENSGEAKSGPASASCAMDCSAGAYLSPTIGLASVGENFEAERRALMREAETKYRQVCLATDVLPPT